MRPILFRLLCALALMASLVAYTGCGGSSDTATYKSNARKVANDFKASAQSASAQLQTARNTAGRVKGLEALKGSVDNAANGFEKLSPPSNVKTENANLVSGLRSLSGDVSAVEQAVKTNNNAQAQATLPKLRTHLIGVQSAVQALEAKIGK